MFILSKLLHLYDKYIKIYANKREGLYEHKRKRYQRKSGKHKP